LFNFIRNKKIEMNEIIFLIEEALEGGYTAKAIGEGIFTEGDTLEEIKKNIREAVGCHFEEGKKPKLIRLHMIKEEVISA
jgi:predicted RNase H-like HicB family nuclease